MALPDIKDIKALSDDDLQAEVLALKKELFQLRLKRSTRQPFKPHEFKHTKHRLAQLLTIERERQLAEAKVDNSNSSDSSSTTESTAEEA
ncbi:LSU ribosomal protein L29P [Thalassoporum mexicanum PCC 7367]|uniref:50S ribosomal protein L29 n=1 Tax=Thalassoporum mexicanum TaxID=3457544 RepID=UPI00029FF6F2|nr:50S ribosomal protein L29 [Pseudanabaena sp. PCC 7367]AFY69384.1 LSU ribosomal protein L29P [Pseudanabaena sp. PCC 7367]